MKLCLAATSFDWSQTGIRTRTKPGDVDRIAFVEPMEWCVVRFVDDGFGDDPRTPGEWGHALCHLDGSERSRVVAHEFGDPLISDERGDVATFATEEEALKIASYFGKTGRGREHYAVRTSDVRWRVLLYSHWDGSCRAVYDGNDFARTFVAWGWARGKLIDQRGDRRSYIDAFLHSAIHRSRAARRLLEAK